MLSREHVHALHKAVTALDIPRESLLAGIPPAFVGTLRDQPSRSQQHLHDLTVMIQAGPLVDGSVPLRTWLSNAVLLSSPRREVAVFEAAIADLDRSLTDAAGKVAAAAPIGSTAPVRPPMRSPFQTAGDLSPKHATYISRECDAHLKDALGKPGLISIEGESQIGKSSLANRAIAEHGVEGGNCYQDMADLRQDSERFFFNRLFSNFSGALGRPIDDWTDLHAAARHTALTLVFDELGLLKPKFLRGLIAPLHSLSMASLGKVRIMVCQPAAIVDLLTTNGIVRETYLECWHVVRVGPLTEEGVRQILSHLSPRARSLAEVHLALVMQISAGRPVAVQRLCDKLFNADQPESKVDDLRTILRDRRSYL